MRIYSVIFEKIKFVLAMRALCHVYYYYYQGIVFTAAYRMKRGKKNIWGRELMMEK